jgi:hypothetical protein
MITQGDGLEVPAWDVNRMGKASAAQIKWDECDEGACDSDRLPILPVIQRTGAMDSASH